MDNRQNFKANSRSGRSRKKLYGILGGAALAAAVTFGGNALIPTTSATTYAQSVTATATPSATSNSTQQSPLNGPRNGPGRRGGGDAALSGVSGTLSAINGSTLTLKQGDVIVIQATVNANTVYTKAGKTISLSDLKVGQLLSVRETKASDGTVSISAVEVQLNHAGGTISALDSSSLTLTKPDNSTIKVNLDSSTSYLDLGKTITLADLKAGVRVEADGVLNSDGSLSAEVINVQHDRLGGTITAISGSTLTVQLEGRGGPGPRGQVPGRPASATPDSDSNNSSSTTTTATISVDSSTVYLEAGQTAQLSDLAVGDRINAAGTLSSDGKTLSALQVIVALPHYQGQVTSVSGTTIVIQDRAGTHTLEVNSDTKYLNGQTSATLSDVKTGVNLSAEGKVDSSGKMTASVIQLGQPKGPGR